MTGKMTVWPPVFPVSHSDFVQPRFISLSRSVSIIPEREASLGATEGAGATSSFARASIRDDFFSVPDFLFAAGGGHILTGFLGGPTNVAGEGVLTVGVVRQSIWEFFGLRTPRWNIAHAW